MREILFRGKRADNGEWVEGTLYQIGKEQNPFIMLVNRCAESHEVDPATVGQYTGLTDKNGTKIFEGDIVKIKDFTHGCALNYKQPTSNWNVYWDKKTARFCIAYMSIFPFDFTKTSPILDSNNSARFARISFEFNNSCSTPDNTTFFSGSDGS